MPKLLAALDEMNESSDHEQTIPTPIFDLPKRFDFRNARCKLLALRLAAKLPNGEELLAREGAKAVVPLITDRNLISADLFASPANRIVVSPEEAASVRTNLMTAILDMAEMRTTDHQIALLDRHLITRFEEGEEVLVHRDFYANLIEQRVVEIRSAEWELLEDPVAPELASIYITSSATAPRSN